MAIVKMLNELVRYYIKYNALCFQNQIQSPKKTYYSYDTISNPQPKYKFTLEPLPAA